MTNNSRCNTRLEHACFIAMFLLNFYLGSEFVYLLICVFFYFFYFLPFILCNLNTWVRFCRSFTGSQWQDHADTSSTAKLSNESSCVLARGQFRVLEIELPRRILVRVFGRAINVVTTSNIIIGRLNSGHRNMST